MTLVSSYVSSDAVAAIVGGLVTDNGGRARVLLVRNGDGTYDIYAES